MKEEGFINKAEELLESENWEDRDKAMNLIKENSIGIRGTNELSLIFGLIKKALRDKDGRVRNNAVYAFNNFRPGVFFSPPHLNIEMFRELYAHVLDEKDSKIKKAYLRCLNYMKSVDLEFKFRDVNAFDEYNEITSYIEKETEGKYDIKYTKNPEIRKKFEELARKICIAERNWKTKQDSDIDGEVIKIWKENEFLAEELADAYYDSLFEESKEFIGKDSKENVGYNMFADGIRVGLDIIMPLLSQEMRKKVKKKIGKMLTKRAIAEGLKNDFWREGDFIESIDPNDPNHKEKIKYFEEKPCEPKDHSCKKCDKPIGKHNFYWHDGMCDDCFDETYFSEEDDWVA